MKTTILFILLLSTTGFTCVKKSGLEMQADPEITLAKFEKGLSLNEKVWLESCLKAAGYKKMECYKELSELKMKNQTVE